MRSLVLVLTFITSSLAFSEAAILCETEDRYYLSASMGAEKFDNFAEECEMEIFEGLICFYGKRSEVIDLIKKLGETTDLFGGEYSIRGVGYYGPKQVRYKIWDGPGGQESKDNQIDRCN